MSCVKCRTPVGGGCGKCRQSEDVSKSAVMSCSIPELDMSDEQIMDWAKATYGDKLPERLAELKAIIDRAIAKSRKARKE